MLAERSSVKESPVDKQPLALVSREVPRFQVGLLWHSTAVPVVCREFQMEISTKEDDDYYCSFIERLV